MILRPCSTVASPLKCVAAVNVELSMLVLTFGTAFTMHAASRRGHLCSLRRSARASLLNCTTPFLYVKDRMSLLVDIDRRSFTKHAAVAKGLLDEGSCAVVVMLECVHLFVFDRGPASMHVRTWRDLKLLI